MISNFHEEVIYHYLILDIELNFCWNMEFFPLLMRFFWKYYFLKEQESDFRDLLEISLSLEPTFLSIPMHFI
jgi:hypothetical protein